MTWTVIGLRLFRKAFHRETRKVVSRSSCVRRFRVRGLWGATMSVPNSIIPLPPVPSTLMINRSDALGVTKQAFPAMDSLAVQECVGVPLKVLDSCPSLGVQNVANPERISHRSQGCPFFATANRSLTTMDLVAIGLRSENPIDLGHGRDDGSARLGSSSISGMMTINGDGTSNTSVAFEVDLHRGWKSGSLDLGALSFTPSGSEHWNRAPGPHCHRILQAITHDLEGDRAFFPTRQALHLVPDKIHEVGVCCVSPSPLWLAGEVRRGLAEAAVPGGCPRDCCELSSA